MKLLGGIVIFCFSLMALNTAVEATEDAEEAKWIRNPAISPDGKSIVFTYKGDLYRVSSEGGDASRLTFHAAHDSYAVWDNTGTQIAFASNRNGNFDIYVMDSRGGNATRLTYHSADETPFTFSADNDYVLFSAARLDTAEHRQSPDGTFPELYEVKATGGKVQQIFTLPALDVDIDEQGDYFLYEDVKGYENKWRKHHRSAVTRDIWLYDVDEQTHKQLTWFEGEDREAVFSSNGESFYYLSEQNGTFNVFEAPLNEPTNAKQLTDFAMHPVRFLSIGADTLAFTHHGELFTMREGAEPKAITVNIRTQDTTDNISFENIAGKISEFVISPNGKEIGFVALGDVFVASTDGAFVKQITDTAEREAFITFDKEGESLIYSAQRDTQWGIYEATKAREQEPFFYAASLINEAPLLVNNNDNYQPKVSPDGTKIAYIENRRTLRVMSRVGDYAKTLVDRDEMIHFRDGDQQFSWSPDSQWILFQHDRLLNNRDIAIVKADGSEPFKPLSMSGFGDFAPKWVNAGKQVLWFSDRMGLRSYATSGRRETDVYTLFFTQEDWDEFRLSEDDFKLQQAIDEANEEANESESEVSEDDAEKETSDEEKTEEDEAVDPIEIEWKGLDDRIARLTIHSSRLSDAVLNKEADTLYYLTRFEDNADLWTTNLRTKETSKLIGLGARNGSLVWDKDYENLYLLSDGNISKLDLDKKSSERISLNHRVEIDNDLLRQTTFEHVWLRTAKMFYEPTYHGIDWDKMYEDYKPKVAHLGNGYEMAELLSEMIGELNVSHAGAGYRSSDSNDDATAYLGAFFDYKHRQDGLKIVEVVEGGPLDKSRLDITPGMIITKIDGTEITNAYDWAKLLNHKAGKFVLLEIIDDDDNSKQVTVKPISQREHGDLLYKRFVDVNEQEVLKLSDNQLGYVHIPGMSDGPYRNAFDLMLGKHFDKKGIVVDTRFNGGGDLVADLAMFFTGEQFLTYATSDKVVGGEPTSRYTKPVVTLFNEDMYSDGHCYASGFTDLKIGTSIGMPVPGTCSFAGWEGLPTGGYWGMVPVSAKNKAGEWLENNQTSPDIIIKNMPDAISNGKDQQLEKAIEVLLQQVN